MAECVGMIVAPCEIELPSRRFKLRCGEGSHARRRFRSASFQKYRDLPPGERTIARVSRDLGKNVTMLEGRARRWRWLERVDVWHLRPVAVAEVVLSRVGVDHLRRTRSCARARRGFAPSTRPSWGSRSSALLPLGQPR